MSVAVVDQGKGIPLSVRPHIFEPFYTTKGKHGTGLGLSMCWRIAQKHGGVLEIDSNVAQGTTVTLTVPVVRDAPAAAQPVEHPRRPMLATQRVLLIDDQPDMRYSLTEMLKALGHEVTVAADGKTALERIAHSAFSIILTDLGMPGMDGLEVATRAKQLQPHVPVVLLTGWGAHYENAPPEAVDVGALQADHARRPGQRALAGRLRRRGLGDTTARLPPHERPLACSSVPTLSLHFQAPQADRPNGPAIPDDGEPRAGVARLPVTLNHHGPFTCRPRAQGIGVRPLGARAPAGCPEVLLRVNEHGRCVEVVPSAELGTFPPPSSLLECDIRETFPGELSTLILRCVRQRPINLRVRNLVAAAAAVTLTLPVAWGCDAISTEPSAAQRLPEPLSRGALPPAEQATVDLFEDVRRSVVYITTLAHRRNLFTGVATEVPRGTGSGFVWDDAGHIVTNLHVLQNAAAARVVLYDQSASRAALVGFSRAHDLAVLKIDTPDNRFAPGAETRYG